MRPLQRYRSIRTSTALAALVALASLYAAPAAAQRLPTEAELERKLSGPPPDDREYQRRSTKSFKGRTGGAASWVKDKLSGFRVTPGRLCLALGIVGWLYTRNKNKKNNTGWMAIYVISILSLLAGGAMALARYL